MHPHVRSNFDAIVLRALREITYSMRIRFESRRRLAGTVEVDEREPSKEDVPRGIWSTARKEADVLFFGDGSLDLTQR